MIRIIDDPLSRIDFSACAAGHTCWEWIGLINDQGYGVISMPNNPIKKVKAHRLLYERYIGPIPKGMFACHHCDNPGCVRPEHLFLGSQKDNLKDCKLKGRNPKKETHGSAKLTYQDVSHIRKIYIPRNREFSQYALARKYGVSQMTICDILHNKIWSD